MTTSSRKSFAHVDLQLGQVLGAGHPVPMTAGGVWMPWLWAFKLFEFLQHKEVAWYIERWPSSWSSSSFPTSYEKAGMLVIFIAYLRGLRIT